MSQLNTNFCIETDQHEVFKKIERMAHQMFSFLFSFVRGGGIDPEPFIGEWGLYSVKDLNHSVYTIELHYRNKTTKKVEGSLWRDGILKPDLSSKAKNPMILQFDLQIQEHVVKVFQLPELKTLENFQIINDEATYILKSSHFGILSELAPNYALRDFVRNDDYLVKPIPSYPWEKSDPDNFIGLPLEEESHTRFINHLIFAISFAFIFGGILLIVKMLKSPTSKTEEEKSTSSEKSQKSKESTTDTVHNKSKQSKKGKNDNKKQHTE